MMSVLVRIAGARGAPVLLGLLAGLPLMAAQSRAYSAVPGSGPMYLAFAGGGNTSYLGVNIAEVNSERAKTLRLPAEEGVEITRVEPDSPAEKAGLKVGDVVVQYNGEHVEGMEQFGRMVRETPAGRRVTMQVSRGGTLQLVTAVIGSRGKFGPEGLMVMPPFQMPQLRLPDIPEGFPAWRSGMLGIETEALNPQLADFFGVKQGVLVRSVMTGSAAEKAGIKAGDVVTKVDDQEVTTPGQVSSAIHAARGRHSISLKLVRSRHEMTVTATLSDDESSWPATPETRVIQQEVRK